MGGFKIFNDMSFLFREGDLEKLKEAYEVIDSKGFQVRFIVGKTGMGKSVLLDRFLEEIEGRDEKVLVTGCACTMVGEEYQPFKDILQEMIRELTVNREGKRKRKEKWKKVFGASADMLLKVAPDLIGDFVPMGGLINLIGEKVLEESGIKAKVEKLKNGEEACPDLLRLSDQYLEVLKLIAGQYRLIVYIDNLQWADRSSLELLQRLQIGLRHLPVMLVGCYRSADLIYGTGEERHPLETFVTHMKVNCGDVFVDLDRCDEKERREWLRHLLELEKVKYDDHFAEEMYRKTGGNPLYVSELLRAMRENGQLKRNRQEEWEVTGQLDWQLCPVRIEGVVREEVAALGAEKAKVLAFAAVQGQKFRLSVLACMAGKEEMELLYWMTEELARQRHLVYEEECFRLNGEVMSSFCFTDSFLKEYLYNGLGVSQRMLLHGKVARLLEELYAGKLEEVVFELAWHCEQSGEQERALEYLEICVSEAGKKADYRCAVECAERALQLKGVNLSVWRLRRLKAMRKSGIYACKILQEIYESDCPEDRASEWNPELWHLLLMEGKLKQAMQLAEETGKVARGITAFWLGDFRLCKKMLEGEEEGLFYLALAEFHCGEYEKADNIYHCLGRSCRPVPEDCFELALLGVWLAYLDEDMERMKEELRRVDNLKYTGSRSRVIDWLEWFDAVLLAETEIWKGLELLEERYRKMDDKRGSTLYGVMGCRLCLKKGLYEVFDHWWEKAVLLALESGEKTYSGELFLLKKRRLELVGREKEAAEWGRKMQIWTEETGGWLPDGLS